MKALIIAAGEGSRFSNLTKETPKPLLEVSGVPLIERIITNLKNSGITDIVMVVGYLSEKITQKLGTGERLGVSIHYVHNDEWRKKNGISVLKSKEKINDPFFLLMSDHLFDEEIVKQMKKVSLDQDEVMLAVDRNLSSEWIDLDDVTKVLEEKNKIADIGKNITHYNVFDTGIFLCTPALFTALEKSIVNGDCSLSDGMKLLAKKGKARIFDIQNRFWMDVDTPELLEKAEKRLFKENAAAMANK